MRRGALPVLSVAILIAALVGKLTAAPLAAGEREWRFAAVEVHVDPGQRELAAYQIEITGESDDVQIVGVEGGEHRSFREPPYYDPAALGDGRIILAAFSTAPDLPAVRSRVATLHVRWHGAAPAAELRVDVQAAADADGRPIDIETDLVIADGGRT